MAATIIESAQCYRHAIKRECAIKEMLKQIADTQASAASLKVVGHLEPEDMKSLGALDDAAADLRGDLATLKEEIDRWEDKGEAA